MATLMFPRRTPNPPECEPVWAFRTIRGWGTSPGVWAPSPEGAKTYLSVSSKHAKPLGVFQARLGVPLGPNKAFFVMVWVQGPQVRGSRSDLRQTAYPYLLPVIKLAMWNF